MLLGLISHFRVSFRSAINVQIEKAEIKLLERVAISSRPSQSDLASMAVSPNASMESLPSLESLAADSAAYSYATLAELKFNLLQVKLESHPLQVNTKVSANSFLVCFGGIILD